VSQPKEPADSGPNPQGKGLVPVLGDLGALQPAIAGPKTPGDLLRDYCLSSLVLAATFSFKPVVGKTYYLYATANAWNLSMIAPGEWSREKAGNFLASCRLRPDMTWELDSAGLQENPEVLAKARDYIRGFVDTLAEQESIRERLPFYVESLPYYQRLLATALANSLEKSLPASGDDVKALLGAGQVSLLPGGGA
jgi:hypothetical protein